MITFDYEFLNILMIRNGMTARGLAQRLGITSLAVQNWTSGSSEPRIDRLPALAELFGVQQRDFLKEKANGI